MMPAAKPNIESMTTGRGSRAAKTSAAPIDISSTHEARGEQRLQDFLVYRGRGQLTCSLWMRSLMGEKDWAVFSPRDWKPTAMAWIEQARAWRALSRRCTD
jgi:hypothetical protein